MSTTLPNVFLGDAPAELFGPIEEKRHFAVRRCDPHALAYVTRGAFTETLARIGQTIAVTRGSEHFVVFVSEDGGRLRQESWRLPKPTGLAFDAATERMVACSTGEPNALVWADRERSNVWAQSNCAHPKTFLVRRAIYLPSTAYIHEIVFHSGNLLGTVTGHNFVGAFDEDGECRVLWRPLLLDELGDAGTARNLIQLNSMALGADLERSYFTAFALGLEPKSWKLDGGPAGKGVVLSGMTREPLLSGLTCPHSARLAGGRLWVCNSGQGSFGYIDDYASNDAGRARYVEIGRPPGFVRGLAIVDEVVLIGLSKVLPDYSAYAPGVDSVSSKCGIWMYCARSGRFLGSLEWPKGGQIHDVQVVGARHGEILSAA
jgi:uncharacterized protein (TIGR03032 family)